MRILFVTPYIPSLIRVRSYNLIRALTDLGHHVHLVALRPPEDRFASVDALRKICAQVDVFPLSRVRTLWNAVAALPSSLSLQAAYSHHPRAEQHLRRLAATGQFDILHIEHLRGAVLADRLNGIPRVWDSVDSIAYLFEQASRMAPRLTQRLMARLDLGRTRRFEARAPHRFDRTVVTSPIDVQALLTLAGDGMGERIVLLPNGVNLDYFRPVEGHLPEPATILFSGKMSYHANSAAALYLAREIMPQIWQRRPDTRLLVVGKDPSPTLRALGHDPRVDVTGYVDDVRPYFRRATAAISPLLYGAGIQNKVLEAMASGVPVITAPQVSRALQAEAGHDLLIANGTDQFVSQALDLISDPIRRKSVAVAGRKYVERWHNWREIAQKLVAVYTEVAA